jgi:hypothetical protein
MSHQSSYIRKQLNQAIDWFGMRLSKFRMETLVSTLKLEVFNETTFTPKEFDAVFLNHLAKGNVLKRPKHSGIVFN